MARDADAWLGRLTVAASVLGVAVAAGQRFVEGDTLWHIRTGQWILERGAVPHRDPFSWTAGGVPWTAHEWLWDVLAALAWREWAHWGIWLLLLAGIALYAAALWGLARERTHPILAGLLVGGALTAAIPFWSGRPHVLALGITALWLWLVERAFIRPRYLWFLPPLALLWANMHASAPFGVVLLFLAVLLRPGSRRQRFLAVVAGVASAAAVCFTPQGWRIWEYTAQAAGHPAIVNNIGEWTAPDFHNVLFVPTILFLVLTIGALTWGERRRALPPFEGVLFLGTLVMFLIQCRHQPLFLLAAALALSCLLRPPERLVTLTRLVGILVPVAVMAMVMPHLNPSWITRPRESVAFPIKAVAFMERRGLTEGVFNYYSWGGYLIWRGHKPFIDGRADMYVLAGTGVLEDYLKVMAAESVSPEQILREYGVRTVLIPRDTPLRWLLERSAGWKRVYLDDTAVVFVREGSGRGL